MDSSRDEDELIVSLLLRNVKKKARKRSGFLATGDSYGSFHYNYRMGISTVSMIIVEVCVAIWERLSGIYMVMPSSPDDWEKLANDFYLRWNYPNSLGAIDGKNIHIQAPNNSGSKYFCYKGHFSIVLLALVDANYCFTYIDVGNYGSASDGGIFARSTLSEAIDKGTVTLS
ncbi:uncharacterized protein LOC117112557 [Anneissia japonica]|uniref:uncharacterized protein LOC117112557 n=1 Tax=Anneissia japonica TaxID=1529436 RepID=UPI0014257E07|nr:uncharacterized protein LOC117112557 [Anneissia japonica]